MKVLSGVGRIIMVVFLVCGLNIESHAVSIEYLPLENIVAHAAKIARIRITAKEPIEFEFEGKTRECGHLYTTEVVQSFKGGRASFQFALEFDQDCSGFNNEYFITVYHRTLESVLKALRPIIDNSTGLEKEKLLCGLSIEYFVKTTPQMLLPFGLEASKQYGGEWLRQRRLSVVSQTDFDHREIYTRGETYMVLKWRDVERAIRKELQMLEGNSTEHDL